MISDSSSISPIIDELITELPNEVKHLEMVKLNCLVFLLVN